MVLNRSEEEGPSNFQKRGVENLEPFQIQISYSKA